MIVWLAMVGCNGDKDAVEFLSVEELQDPATCVECHPDHVREWEGSMHAYASEDPVFLALNAQGQEETNGELGDFCIQCHAPLAVQLGLTTDGLNLDEVPDHLEGVNCYFCHQVEAVEGEHNNPLRLAMNGVMFGSIGDPVDNTAHASEYSGLHDRDDGESSAACGSCHDIVTPLGGHIERTFSEWQDSLFSDPLFGVGCIRCHMTGRQGVAAEADDVKLRRVHDHSLPGVDVALTDFPHIDEQRALVQELLDDTVVSFLCVQPPTGTTTLAVVTLENVAGGHSFPSGATADRRVWVEVVAYEAGVQIWASGQIPDDQAVSDVDPVDDPDLWTLHSTLLDEAGEPTHKFWEAADIESDGLLKVQATLDPEDPAYVQTHQSRNYLVRNGTPDRITVAVKTRALPLDLLDELVAEGRLDAAVRDAVPTFTLGPTQIEWTSDIEVNSGSLACVPEPPPVATTKGTP